MFSYALVSSMLLGALFGGLTALVLKHSHLNANATAEMFVLLLLS